MNEELTSLHSAHRMVASVTFASCHSDGMNRCYFSGRVIKPGAGYQHPGHVAPKLDLERASELGEGS